MKALKYEKLDDIGFVGYQKKRSKAEMKRDAKRTTAFIEAYKAKAKTITQKKSSPALVAK